MAQVTLSVGGRSYELSCRDGEEERLRMLAGMVDMRAGDAARAVGSANEPRQLLLAALLLADELSELRSGAPDPAREAAEHALEALATQVEALADRLENGDPTS